MVTVKVKAKSHKLSHNINMYNNDEDEDMEGAVLWWSIDKVPTLTAFFCDCFCVSRRIHMIQLHLIVPEVIISTSIYCLVNKVATISSEVAVVRLVQTD